jgi:hypothetical protein
LEIEVPRAATLVRNPDLSECPEKLTMTSPMRAAWTLMILATLRSVSRAFCRRWLLAIGRNTGPVVMLAASIH